MSTSHRSASLLAMGSEDLSLSTTELEVFFPAHLAVDRNGRIVAAGPSLRKLLGEDVLGARIDEVVEVERVPADPQEGGPRPVRLSASRPTRLRLRGAEVQRGGLTWFLVGHHPDGQAGPALSGADFGAADATQDALDTMAGYARLLEDTRALTQSLEKQKQAAEAANEAKSTFLATMSHEIRTPMNGVLGVASLLEETPLSEEQRELVAVIISSGQALMGILNDVLDLSKVEAGRGELERTALDVAELAAQIQALFAPEVRGKRLDFAVELASPVPPLQGDPARLRQVMLNLIGNAIKFTDEGRVAVTISFAPKSKRKGLLSLVVSDTGIGIAPGAVERIFMPFVQADSSTTRRFGGTGLGLSITRRLVELMGGTIAVQSRVGRGSTFRVDIPAETAPVGEEKPASGPTAPSALPDFSGRGLRLLVAEDNQTNRFVMRRFLDRLGIAADYAENGIEALVAWERTRYDMILMDIEMPMLDGIETTREIRRKEAGSDRVHVPIVALSADALSERSRCACEAGMNGFVVKPIDIRTLAGLLIERLGTGPCPAEAGSAPLDDGSRLGGRSGQRSAGIR